MGIVQAMPTANRHSPEGAVATQGVVLQPTDFLLKIIARHLLRMIVLSPVIWNKKEINQLEVRSALVWRTNNYRISVIVGKELATTIL